MNGRESFLLNDIKGVIRSGGNVTHILNVKVSRQMSAEQGTAIRRAIYQRIANKPLTKHVTGVPATITWRTTATSSSAYYHADVPLFTDIVVKEHTKQLLRDILNAIDNQFGNVFTSGITGLAFLVSKPLSRQVVIMGDESEADSGDDADEVDEALEREEN
ncbi:hypothetical protein HK102_007803 [Quaeritorhiza haematococci]|nr:hypothetical protein HK102_007803 [Quaeritorhiza haematococci]